MSERPDALAENQYVEDHLRGNLPDDTTQDQLLT
jgi:hypothetical protein